jgi:hypothetical protein
LVEGCAAPLERRAAGIERSAAVIAITAAHLLDRAAVNAGRAYAIRITADAIETCAARFPLRACATPIGLTLVEGRSTRVSIV